MRFAGIRIRKMLLGLCLVSGISQAATSIVQEITLRHALDGKAQDALATLVMRFNDSLRGKGKVVLQDARSVENKQQLPTLALLDVDDSVAFFDTRPRFMPLSKIMRDGGQPLNTKRLYPQMLDAVMMTAARRRPCRWACRCLCC
jgi:sn-glycerol 3-phosphate transport system substrate-binding protein